MDGLRYGNDSHANTTTTMTTEKKQNITDGIGIKGYGMIMHMNCGKTHHSKYKGTFVCEGKPLHDKEFIREGSVTSGGFGKYSNGTALFYLTEPGSPAFPTAEALILHYHKPETTQP